VSWPAYKETLTGISSQLGELSGITGLSSPRRFEMAPYAVTKNVTVADGGGFGHEQEFTAGADFKYGVSSNMTLSGTVNPDFGQVEADPAVVNLTAFETVFEEKRPFFIEGNEILGTAAKSAALRATFAPYWGNLVKQYEYLETTLTYNFEPE